MTQGLVRLRILRAAIGGTAACIELSEDLAIAGHNVSLGTVYPVLHDLEQAGWLKSTGKTLKGKRRRYYRAPKKGREQLEHALIAVNQFLFDGRELLPSTTTVGRSSAQEAHAANAPCRRRTSRRRRGGLDQTNYTDPRAASRAPHQPADRLE